jgi:type I restriction enzyme R subunit
MTQFAFFGEAWPGVLDAANRAEASVRSDPRSACFYARRALELAMHWLFKHDGSLRLPYQDNLSALVHEPTFKQAAGEAIFSKARVIVTLGNRAVHSHRPIPENDALVAVRELFHFGYWLARTCGERNRPPPTLAFDPTALPAATAHAQRTTEQLAALEASLHERDERLDRLLAVKNALDAELVRLREEVAKATKAAASQRTRMTIRRRRPATISSICCSRKLAGRSTSPATASTRSTACPTTGAGATSITCCGATITSRSRSWKPSERAGTRAWASNAKLCADCLERRFGQRPVIFYSNGYEHWLWDDTSYPPRQVQGFFKKRELELMVQRRRTRQPLAEATIDTDIAERHYQIRAIRRIGEAFERSRERKALVVMATGAGKTRTV